MPARIRCRFFIGSPPSSPLPFHFDDANGGDEQTEEDLGLETSLDFKTSPSRRGRALVTRRDTLGEVEVTDVDVGMGKEDEKGQRGSDEFELKGAVDGSGEFNISHGCCTRVLIPLS